LDKPFAAYNGDEPYVFVCYAHDDNKVVYPEIASLHEQWAHWSRSMLQAGAATSKGRQGRYLTVATVDKSR